MTRKPFCCSYNGTEITVPLTAEEAEWARWGYDLAKKEANREAA